MCLAFSQYQFPNKTLVTRLTHYQSLDSPYYDPTKSTKDLADIDLTSSISRAFYLTTNTSNGTTSIEPTDIESQLTPGKLNGFLVHLQVGSNQVDQYVYMDTGSSLLWVNCEPCGVDVPWPRLDPKDSSSFKVEGCDFTSVCDDSGAIKIDCEDENYDVKGCKYEVAYGSGYSRGNLAIETFTFKKVADSNETLTGVVFGCAHSTNLFMNGILGLGHGPLSLFSQYSAAKFSYCIGNRSDRSYAHSMLIVGNKTELWGPQTPLVVEDKYYVNLVGAAIGETNLELDPKMFRRNSDDYTGGMVVDSGTTLSFIPQVALTSFEDTTRHLIENELGLNLRPNDTIAYGPYTRLCYNGVVTRDLERFPNVKLSFEGGAVMELTPDNIFQQVDDHNFCLAILPSEIMKTTISILGNLMQQNFYIAFDVEAKKLSFKRMKCKTVEDYYDRDV
ncbi:Eukaryotic aspartyl protease family protein [Striga hermonthica]|uniref:Eukaryotic aspartyl protease family protein n=1 Tax=Striga hermonthica TaxID=68872 RepID=A0A9N7MD81_STRHE|nr:Eukaryotic aspartyl protease family protein [Striga hermonthica]